MSGIKAYATDCANTDKYENWLACHDINPQWAVRNSTTVYLQHVAEKGLFLVEVNKNLEEAVNEYRATYKEWRKFYELLSHGATEAARKDNACFEAGAATVRKALRHEQVGIEKLTTTLAFITE